MNLMVVVVVLLLFLVGCFVVGVLLRVLLLADYRLCERFGLRRRCENESPRIANNQKGEMNEAGRRERAVASIEARQRQGFTLYEVVEGV